MKSSEKVLLALVKRLKYLLSGDVAAENRLVDMLRYKYPDKDKKWCLEKAIFDLERDRGYL